MNSRSKNRGHDERSAAALVAKEVLESMGERPANDNPKGQQEYDALVAMAAGTPDDTHLAFHPQTDLGNAERFSSRQRGRLLHVPEIGWLIWDGRRWARDGAESGVGKAVHETVRKIQDEASAIRDSDLDQELDRRNDQPVMLSDKLAAWGRSSESATKMAAIAKHAAPYLNAEAKDLDRDPWRINVLNGTLHIQRNSGDSDPISFTPHDPSEKITKLAPVKYDPNAKCENYDRFISEVQPNAKMQRFLHQWGGYSLTGDTGEQKLCFFYGKGRNGKSTLVDAWGGVAGDYGETVPIETFLDQGRGRNAGAATPDLALLPGVRFLRTSEPEKGAKLAESLIKLVTGGEPIQARHLNRDYFKFHPSFKLTMSGNYRPSINGTDEGIWRRVVLVPWALTIDKPDPLLPAKLSQEGSGILNRMLDGLRDYLENGLIIPDEVSEATANYRDDSDPLGRFLNHCVERKPGQRVQSSAMHRLYCAWARGAGEREWTAKGLTMALKERGFIAKQSNVMWWLDCQLLVSEIDFADAPAPPHAGADE